MKRMIKHNICGFILGVICCSMTVYAAYNYFASEVSYTPSDKNWNVNSVEEALNELYKIGKPSPVLVGSGSVRFSSGVTTLSDITAYPLEDTNNILQLENNVFIVEKSGVYIITCGIGSDMQGMVATSFSSSVQVQINGEKKCGAAQSYDMYLTDFAILDLKKGDTIVGKYQGDGGSYLKRAGYQILYIG